jgi:ketosteroid isomerase-like protein
MMRKKITIFISSLVLTTLLANITVFGQISNAAAIRDVMAKQQFAWNQGDIPTFMSYYWQSDSLMFIGKNGVTKGFEATKARYLQTYETREKMGTLTFQIKEIQELGLNVAWVLGKWDLARPNVGDIGGYFTLIFRRINGRWVICSDHTS